MTEKKELLLDVRDLHVQFPTARGVVRAVNGVSYQVHEGEIMGIVGESGSGKSAAAYGVMGLLKPPGRVTDGEITFRGQDLLHMSHSDWAAFRGRRISMVFQDPMQCLDPVFTIGSQMTETLLAHEWMPRKEALQRSVEMLHSVGIHEPEQMMKRYPFELSGGMRQRVLIAMAILCKPDLLIADEPTTALDVTIQDQILRLLKRLKQETGMSIVFITHNFGIVADICDRVTVMYGGIVCERGTVEDIFYRTEHPYTRGLMQAIPRADLLTDERLVPIDGTPLDPLDPPTGCPFHPRCPRCMDICRVGLPGERMLSASHGTNCWLVSEKGSEVASRG